MIFGWGAYHIYKSSLCNIPPLSLTNIYLESRYTIIERVWPESCQSLARVLVQSGRPLSGLFEGKHIK